MVPLLQIRFVHGQTNPGDARVIFEQADDLFTLNKTQAFSQNSFKGKGWLISLYPALEIGIHHACLRKLQISVQRGSDFKDSMINRVVYSTPQEILIQCLQEAENGQAEIVKY